MCPVNEVITVPEGCRKSSRPRHLERMPEIASAVRMEQL